MTDKDKMQEEFERNIPYKLQLHKNSIDGSYINVHIQFAWLLWQAAKESDRKELEELRTKLSGKTCFVPPEFTAELEETNKQRLEVHRLLSAETAAKFTAGKQIQALEKKLAEQQALLANVYRGLEELQTAEFAEDADAAAHSMQKKISESGTEELIKRVAAARRQGFDEGLQEIPKMIEESWHTESYEAGKREASNEFLTRKGK